MDLSIVRNDHLPFPDETTATNVHQTSTPLALPAHSPGPGPKQSLANGFKRVCRTEEESPCPFPGLPQGVLEMRVKEGSKIRNLMGFAMGRMQCEDKTSNQVSLRQVIFTGSGRAVTKTITCAEIMKRKVRGLHQLTKLHYKSVRELWESQEGSSAKMTVHRTVPSISILLSKDPLNPFEPGYQPPETQIALWQERQPSTLVCSDAGKRQIDYSVEIQSKRFCPQGGNALN